MDRAITTWQSPHLAPPAAGVYARRTPVGWITLDVWDGRRWRRQPSTRGGFSVPGQPSWKGVICANQGFPWRAA